MNGTMTDGHQADVVVPSFNQVVIPDIVNQYSTVVLNNMLTWMFQNIQGIVTAEVFMEVTTKLLSFGM
jgi:hypothetical protein